MLQAMLAMVLGLAAFHGATASYAKIAGYEPGSDVVQHSQIDLDQKAILAAIKGDMDLAYNVYSMGGNSGGKATLTVSALGADIAKGLTVTQTSSGATGRVKSPAKTGDTTIVVSYTSTASTCIDGGVMPKVTTGCFTKDNPVAIDGKTYTPTAVANSYRTIAGFSTGSSKMSGTTTYDAFKTFYNSGTYADDFVKAAFKKTGDFANKADDFRQECAKKGAPFINVWMYAIWEMEDAIQDCKSGCTDCNMDPVHAWDEAWAFYAGSLSEGAESPGNLIYYLADKRCENYNTCASGTTGISNVNTAILPQFTNGKNKLLEGKCSEVPAIRDRIIELMSVPLIQGALRYAYKVGVQNQGTKAQGEGAAFSHAILGRINACNSAKATLIKKNMGAGVTNYMVDGYENVKAAFESVYQCLGVKCSDVGGLLDGVTPGAFFDKAGPCTDNSDGSVTPSNSGSTPSNSATSTPSNSATSTSTPSNSGSSGSQTSTVSAAAAAVPTLALIAAVEGLLVLRAL